VHPHPWRGVMDLVTMFVFDLNGREDRRRPPAQRGVSQVAYASSRLILYGAHVAAFHALFVRHENQTISNVKKVAAH
jgi:hypothetical protein